MTKTQKQSPAARKTGAGSGGHGKMPSRGEPHPLEWAIGGISAALVLSMIGFVLYQGISASNEDADLKVAIVRIDETEGGDYSVQFQAANRADRTAAEVEIIGRLNSGAQTIETHSVTLDYVPARSTRMGVLLFERDPAAGELDIRAEGYRAP